MNIPKMLSPFAGAVVIAAAQREDCGASHPIHRRLLNDEAGHRRRSAGGAGSPAGGALGAGRGVGGARAGEDAAALKRRAAAAVIRALAEASLGPGL